MNWSPIKRLLCLVGIHSWMLWSVYPVLNVAIIRCADCGKRHYVKGGV